MKRIAVTAIGVFAAVGLSYAAFADKAEDLASGTVDAYLQSHPEMVIDLTKTSGEYCINTWKVGGGHMTHYATDPSKTQEDLVDFVPERFTKRIDYRVTTLNSLTSCSPTGAKTPVVLPDDREAVLAAIRTSRIRPEGSRVVYVRDTLALEHVLVSEACRPLVEGEDGIDVVSGPEFLSFDERGRLQSPFVLPA